MNTRIHNEELDKAERDDPHLNSQYRHGGNIVEDREYCRDSVTEMETARRRPDILAEQLHRMGVTTSGDDPADLEL